MAGAGFKDFTAGDILTATQVDEYLMQQTVMRFADATARTTALSGVLAEGMLSYLNDTNKVQVYNGSSWVDVGGSSPLTTKGDLYTYSTSDTRLGVGANGTVLTADSSEATGLKWASPSSSVSGVSLYQASQSMSNGTNTNFTGFTEDYDSNGFYSTGANITIPTAGKYLIQYSVNFAPNATGYRTLGISKNSATLQENDFGNATAQSFNRPVGVIVRAFTFAANDVLNFYTYQDSGGALAARAYVTITYLGA